jgi:hypothetical protein
VVWVSITLLLIVSLRGPRLLLQSAEDEPVRTLKSF